MRILFLSPPSKNLDFPPLGIAYITSFLNENGHQASIFDGHNRSHDEIISAVKKINPEVYSVSIYDLDALNMLKKTIAQLEAEK